MMGKNIGGARNTALGKANGYATSQKIMEIRAWDHQEREEKPINQAREASPISPTRNLP